MEIKQANPCHFYLSFVFLRFYLFIFREVKGGRKRERKISMCGSLIAPTGHLAHNPDMCPNWESNWWPFGLQPTLNPLSYTNRGFKCIIKVNYINMLCYIVQYWNISMAAALILVY